MYVRIFNKKLSYIGKVPENQYDRIGNVGKHDIFQTYIYK